MENVISQNVFDENKKPLGVIVAAKCNDNQYNIEYSYKNPKELKYNKDFGYDMAYERAINNRCGRINMRIMNETMLDAYMKMIHRASRYFKNCCVSDKVLWMSEHYSYYVDEHNNVHYEKDTTEPRK